jgi:ABC-type transport system substrate-binding protein
MLTAAGLLAAQQPTPKKDEVEETGPRKSPKKIVPIDEGAGKTKADVQAPDAAIDLNKEADAANHAEVKKLFRSLAKQCDRINEKSGKVVEVEPLGKYVGKKVTEDFTVKPLEKPRLPLKYRPTDLSAELPVEHYEEAVMSEVTKFVALGLDRKLSSEPGYLSRDKVLAAAEKALQSALNWHVAAVEHKQRFGAGWDAVKARLQADLFTAQRDQLTIHADAKDWEKANDVAFRIMGSHPDDPSARQEVILLQIKQADSTLKDGTEEDYKRARAAIDQLETTYPSTARDKKLDPLRQKLRDRAAEHLKKAKDLAARGKATEALAQLNTAEAIGPDLKGIRELRIELKAEFPILYVGVPGLPERMSPAGARTDPERWAVELLFEGLVQAVPDPAAGRVFRSQLADGVPPLVGSSREFTLPRGVRWPVAAGPEVPDQSVTAFDVAATLDMLRALPGYAVSENLDLLTEHVDDAHRMALGLKRGFIDPLALAEFKVMPGRLMQAQGKQANDLNFALNPVGSGPYKWRGREKDEFGREQVVFEMNPAYRSRPGKLGKPQIREIRFVTSSSDPTADIKAGRMHLLLDVPTGDWNRMRSPASGLHDYVADYTAPTRRIWMLAVNHRRQALRDPQLRRAIAHAVGREQILNDVFRASATEFHRPLNGPFPPNTWACPPKQPSLDRPELAAKLAGDRPGHGTKLTLTLAHADEPRAGEVCRKIKEQVEKAAPDIELQLKPMSAADLYQRVRVEFDYDLAYCSYDYRGEWYNLGSLLDPPAAVRGGRNFLGYGASGEDEADRALLRLLEEIRTHRDFAEIRRLSHRAHELFNGQMPFVPLWQLDFHIMVHKDLKIFLSDPKHPDPPNLIDPLRVFTRVEDWQLR